MYTQKSKVLVMAESIPAEGKVTKSGNPRKVGHIKMFVIDNLKSETIDEKVIRYIKKDSTIDSDDSTRYSNLKNLVEKHRPKVIPKEHVGKLLPWVHIGISNAKRLLLNTFHDIQPEFLQSYFNEYCYMFNRRSFGEMKFDRLMWLLLVTKMSLVTTLSNHFKFII